MFIDSHCHLNFPELRPNMDAIRQAMQQAKVEGALVISISLEEFDEVHQLAMSYPNFWASAGVHPDTETGQEPTLDDLLQRGSRPKVLAIGETGLDYYRLNGRSVADMHWQRERFRTHIRAARQLGKPLIIHTRSAADDTLAILREEGETGQGADCCGGVFHCFTETLDVARAALEMGYYISFRASSPSAMPRICATLPLMCHWSACSSRPIVPIWLPCRIGAKPIRPLTWCMWPNKSQQSKICH